MNIQFFTAVLGAGLLLAGGCASRDPGFQGIVSGAKEKVFPAVVYIQAVSGNLKSGKAQNEVVSGSGVIISPGGELLTNFHVIDKAQKIRCQLEDGRAFPATVVGQDKDIDLALLKLELPSATPPLPYARLDRHGRLTEGDFVMAMGAPWGLNRSVSIGIISCSTRYLPDTGNYSLWYQTDASISPGNSGGPLVDTQGNVVAINTLGRLWGGAVAFSIPATTIADVLPRLRAYGGVNWAWFGLNFQPLRDFDRDIYFDYPDGVMVSGTEPGSPARKAGFLPGDRITAIAGEAVTVKTAEELPDFQRKLGLLPFDEPVKFTVFRHGREEFLSVAPVAKGELEGEEAACPRWGFTAKAINRFDTPNLHFYRNDGVYIYGIAPYGNAGRSNLQQNDILASIDGKPVVTLQDLKEIYEKALSNLDSRPRATFAVLRNGRLFQVVMDYSTDYEKE